MASVCRCDGRVQSGPRHHTPRHRLALRSPSRIGRVASNIRLSACPRVPTSGTDKAEQGGREAKDVDGTLEIAGGKYGRGRVRSRKLQGRRANRGRWARAVSRAWRGCSFPQRKGARECYLIHRR
jgi:hypothetical protein